MKIVWRIALSYLITALAFLAADMVWLSTMSARLYQPALAGHLAAQPDLGAAAAFYAIYFVGMTVFTVRPWLRDESLGLAACRAALFGAVAYATYDLTNQATLSGWPWQLTVVDIVWGAVATAIATAATRLGLLALK